MHLKTLALGRTLTMAVPYCRSLIKAIMLLYQMSAVLSSWSSRMKSGASGYLLVGMKTGALIFKGIILVVESTI
jgi:hypothetical protein